MGSIMTESRRRVERRYGIHCNITLEHSAESIMSRLGRVLYVNGDAVNQ